MNYKLNDEGKAPELQRFFGFDPFSPLGRKVVEFNNQLQQYEFVAKQLNGYIDDLVTQQQTLLKLQDELNLIELLDKEIETLSPIITTALSHISMSSNLKDYFNIVFKIEIDTTKLQTLKAAKHLTLKDRYLFDINRLKDNIKTSQQTITENTIYCQTIIEEYNTKLNSGWGSLLNKI